MQHSNVNNIKRAQKESVLFREISSLFLRASFDDKRLSGLVVNRVKLSKDKSVCYVYFYTKEGEEHFKHNLLDLLKCYKPSVRKAIADEIAGRYVPNFLFKYDVQHEKQDKINNLIDKLKREGKL
ncbi:ribosome-binding factor A [bacterium]|jgi:ribosome-binding factor A|nr:ribosome-binding factor A [bacterium]